MNKLCTALSCIALATVSQTLSPVQGKDNPGVKVQQKQTPAAKFDYYVSTGAFDQANKLVAQLSSQSGSTDQVSCWAGCILSAQCRYEEAVTQFDKVKSFKSQSSRCQALAAKAYANLQNFTKAIALCNLSIAQETNRNALDTRAACYMAQKNYEEASKDFKTCGDTDPNYRHMFYARAAKALLNANKDAEALKLAEAATKCPNGAHDATTFLCYGFCLSKLNRPTEALDAYSKAIGFGKAEEKRKLPSEAKAIEVSIQICNLLKARADLYNKLGQKDKAQTDLNELKRRSNDVENTFMP